MPTPVEHLRIAEQILASPSLPEAIRSRLDQDEAVRGAYFFGHIAPDVQVISRQPRETTHFFTVPLTDQRAGYKKILMTYPWLSRPSNLPAAQSAFLTGYLSHLLLDEYWVREVFQPVFGSQQMWGDWRERLLLHNVLRTWLDRRDLPQLQDGIGDRLRYAEPKDWLPFAADADLRRWRDLVADQLAPGAEVKTVEIFADRARIPHNEFLVLLEPGAMKARVFSRIPLAKIECFRERAFTHTHRLTLRYLNGCAYDESE